jgi:4-hydroxy-L-threonine phosphate dehydrogenase PdxA
LAERLQNISKLNERLNVENKGLLERSLHLQTGADITVKLQSQVQECEITINSQKDKITELVNTIANIKDNYNFLKAENEVQLAQIETDSVLLKQNNSHQIDKLKLNLENEMNTSLRLLQENQQLQTSIEIITDEHNQKLGQ